MQNIKVEEGEGYQLIIRYGSNKTTLSYYPTKLLTKPQLDFLQRNTMRGNVLLNLTIEHRKKNGSKVEQYINMDDCINIDLNEDLIEEISVENKYDVSKLKVDNVWIQQF